MKKIVLLVFAAMSMAAFAQSVNPLTVEIDNTNLDSLRNLYISEPAMWRASLNIVQQRLTKNEADIRAARAELKAEQKHAEEREKMIKQSMDLAASLRKLYAKEESELKAMQKNVELQQRNLNNQVELNQETKDAFTLFLEKEQKELGYAIREVAERQRSISELETAIQNNKTDLQPYVMEVKKKAFDIDNLENTLKTRQNAVKANLATVKTMK